MGLHKLVADSLTNFLIETCNQLLAGHTDSSVLQMFLNGGVFHSHEGCLECIQ